MKNYVASFEKTLQTPEDTWKVQRYNLLVTETTTIKEITEWVKFTQNNKTERPDIQIHPLHEI